MSDPKFRTTDAAIAVMELGIEPDLSVSPVENLAYEITKLRDKLTKAREALEKYVRQHDNIEDLDLDGRTCQCELCLIARQALKEIQ